MALSAGTKLGSFEVVELLGVGGMGEVYRARDTKLGREVAIKVLPEAFAANPERLARFEREAQMLAALDHPNIGALYDFQHENDVHFLVMQLVEGDTLAERIARGPLSVTDAIPIFLQIAEALEAAHEAGIVHRDLKPGNVKVDEDGRVRVLDFGMAKSFAGDELERTPTPTPIGPDATTLPGTPTPPSSITREGFFVGTPSYMSPEQARGRRVDKRTDIWAFGCILYATLTGKTPFAGETVSDTIASVLKHEVDLDALPRDTPLKIRDLIERCLKKDRRYRLRDMGDAWTDLKGITTDSGRLLKTAAINDLTHAWPAPTQPARVTRLSIVLPQEASVDTRGGPRRSIAISADGRRIVYVPYCYFGQEKGLYRRDLGDREVQAIPGTIGGVQPFFSPNGEWVGFFCDGDLKKVRLEDGVALTLVKNLGGYFWGLGTWGLDGTIIFSIDDSLWAVSADGDNLREITVRPAEDGETYTEHYCPSVLPDGRTLLYTTAFRTAGETLDFAEILHLDTGEHAHVLEDACRALYATSGHIVFERKGSVMAAPFNVDRLTVTGAAMPLSENIKNDWVGAAQFACSPEGTLAYLPRSESVSSQIALVWVDREGHEEPLPPIHEGVEAIALSPDGSKLALVVKRESRSQLLLYDIERGLTDVLANEIHALSVAWHPEGDRLTYTVGKGDGWAIINKRLGVDEVAETLLESTHSLTVGTWSGDGRTLAYYTRRPGTQGDIMVLDVTGAPAPREFLATAGEENRPAISPNGSWIAYASIETGKFEVYIRRYPDGDRKVRVSTDTGFAPLWAPDGTELFYRGEGRMMAVSIVEEDSAIKPGKPEALYTDSYLFDTNHQCRYAVSPDAQRFLHMKDTEKMHFSGEIVIVQDWFEELKRLAPHSETN